VTPAQADQAVARGAAVLDERGPSGWPARLAAAIRDGRLDMGSVEDCALGHLFGSYDEGKRAVRDYRTSDWAVVHGFAVPGALPEPCRVLAAAWARLLGVEPVGAEP
jgi:hypothetical protein